MTRGERLESQEEEPWYSLNLSHLGLWALEGEEIHLGEGMMRRADLGDLRSSLTQILIPDDTISHL